MADYTQGVGLEWLADGAGLRAVHTEGSELVPGHGKIQLPKCTGRGFAMGSGHADGCEWSPYDSDGRRKPDPPPAPAARREYPRLSGWRDGPV
jgi:hypothetical protein